ncbi:MAG: sulfite exporter TauE/SafE family protein [Acidobacteria bacterium]|nr:sulfite exporter TauE/SafE family protein [Acidobacteriota bacterium]
MTPFQILEVVGIGGLAGALGAVLGLGGGIFLVPFLVAIVGLPFPAARGISLMTVIATSGAVTTGSASRQLVNMRLAMLLQIAAAAGGLTGGVTSHALSERTLTAMFGVTMAGIAVVMMTRLTRRNILEANVVPGKFGGRVFDPDTGQVVSYRVKRTPLAVIVSFVGGNLSSLLGIGGGILVVPALNAWCGVPLRVAAATSSLMIGVTAVSAAPIYYARGEIVAPLAAGGVIGVLIGSRVGLRLGVKTSTRTLKVLMIAVLLTVSVVMFTRL